MTYPRITEGIRALTNPADHALLDACDSVDAIHASLEDENARLRSELDSVGTAAYLYGRSDLKAENAKLLEVIADLEEMLPKSERLYIHETANAIADDNAKLRKLLAEMYPCAKAYLQEWLDRKSVV